MLKIGTIAVDSVYSEKIANTGHGTIPVQDSMPTIVSQCLMQVHTVTQTAFLEQEHVKVSV